MKNDIVQILNEWKEQLNKEVEVSDIYIFGSSIIKDGHLFDKIKSDIDLVVVMPDSLANAVERTRWLMKLKEHKLNLELSFANLFKRANDKVIVSVIPLTKSEIYFDVHKSSVRDFFQDNEFYNISKGEIQNGLVRNAEVTAIDEIIRQLFEFGQNIRHKFLAVGLKKDKNQLDWDSYDESVPKELIRTSALAAFIDSGKINSSEKTDLICGLTYLQSYVFTRRFEDPFYDNITTWISQRLLRKGEQIMLRDFEYLFISEMIFDMALSLNSKNILTSNSQNKEISNNLSEVDTTKSIKSHFVIGQNGLIKGTEDEIFKNIVNAGINLAWKTEPYFDITLEEIDLIKENIEKAPTDGKLIEKYRKLNNLKKELIEGFKYIIYFQNNFFYDSKDKLSDVLTSLRKFTLTRLANVLSNKHFKGVEEGFLQAYYYEYREVKTKYPNVQMKTTLNFGLPNNELDNYLKTNENFQVKDLMSGIMSLAANNQPIMSLNSSLLANFFVPLLVQRIIESKIDAMSTDKEIESFNNEITNLSFWDFGVN